MIKIDLHTHSAASPDGGLKLADYRSMLERSGLDYIAVTDHNTIAGAVDLQEALGDRIIVGEEILTREGEIIGLYLREPIAAGMSAARTIAAIRAQKGLVYIPHPFETIRHGMSAKTLAAIAADVDIVEVHNGRAVFQNFTPQARAWGVEQGKAGAVASDAHGRHGWGKTYSVISAAPTRRTLINLLQTVEQQTAFSGFRALLYPKFNRLKRKVRHV